MSWLDIIKPLISEDFFKSIFTGGISDVGEGYKKYKSGGSFFDFLDRAIDPGGTVDKGTRAFGEQLPPEIRSIAPTAGGAVGTIWGPGGAAAGAGVGSKIAGDDTQTGMQKAGMAAIAAYLFGGGKSGETPVGPSGSAASEVGGLGGTEVGSLATGEAGANVTAKQAAEAMLASEGGGAGGTSVGSLAPTSTTLDDLLSNKLLIKYLTSIGSDLMKYGENTREGLQFTNTNRATNQQIQTMQFAKLMSQLLSQDSSSGKLDKKGITVETGKDSPLYRSFLGENNWLKTNSSLVYGDGKSLSTKPEKGKSMLGSFNAANPFFGNA